MKCKIVGFICLCVVAMACGRKVVLETPMQEKKCLLERTTTDEKCCPEGAPIGKNESCHCSFTMTLLDKTCECPLGTVRDNMHCKGLDGYKYINGGNYDIGSLSVEQVRDDDEMRRSISLKEGFWIKETEVTQGEWIQVTGNNPSYFKGCGLNCPVERINWYEAVNFLNNLSRQENLSECYELSNCQPDKGFGCNDAGNEMLYCKGGFICSHVEWNKSCTGYRLPTEAEWEVAARGGDAKATYNGTLTIKGKNHAEELDEIAVYGGNSEVSYKGGFDCSKWEDKQYSSKFCGPRYVKSKFPNGYGLYDMLGNVSEWTWDAYDKNALGGKYPVTGGMINTNPSVDRVFRGCGWSDSARNCRAAYRFRDTPSLRFGFLGLRPVRSNP
jgi:formylglycine-generating enzyme required for sulfatase activity